jgi:hypothetical protein
MVYNIHLLKIVVNIFFVGKKVVSGNYLLFSHPKYRII